MDPRTSESLEQWLRQHYFSREQDALRGPMAAVYCENPGYWGIMGWTAVKEEALGRIGCDW